MGITNRRFSFDSEVFIATTRIIPMHINKGKTIAQCLKARVDYMKNPDSLFGFDCFIFRFCYLKTFHFSSPFSL